MSTNRSRLLRSTCAIVTIIASYAGLSASGCGGSDKAASPTVGTPNAFGNYTGRAFAGVTVLSQPARIAPLVPNGEVKAIGQIPIVDAKHEAQFAAYYPGPATVSAPKSVRLYICELDGSITAGPFTMDKDDKNTDIVSRWVYIGNAMGGTAAGASPGIKIVKIEAADEGGNKLVQPLGTFYYTPDPTPFDVNEG